MAIASGVAKFLVIKKETSWGLNPPGATGGSYMRRVTSDLSLVKETYESQELRTDYQVSDMRHGVRRVAGNINGELSPLSYQPVFASSMRRLFTAITSVTGLTLTVATSGTNYTITRSAGDWLTSGIKIGTVVRATAGLNALSLNKNLFVLNVTALVLTVMVLNGSALTVEAGVAACTVAAPGMKTYVPTTGHTDESFAFEHWHSDITQSEVFIGCKASKIDVGLPATGMSTIKAEVTGKDVITATSAYFTSVAAAPTSGLLAAVNGAVIVGGVVVALITGLNFTIDGNFSSDPVVGSNTVPDIFEGRVRISGQMTVYFQDAVFRDYFLNETEVGIAVALTTGSAAAAEFLSFAMPRIKVGGGTKSDGEKGIVQTMPFTALVATTGGSGFANELTTMQIHDSLAV